LRQLIFEMHGLFWRLWANTGFLAVRDWFNRAARRSARRPLEQGVEQHLARRGHENRDRRATDALVTSHFRLAAKVARCYRGYGLPLADLVAEAIVLGRQLYSGCIRRILGAIGNGLR
jgi:hypothetical protein